MDSPEEQYIDSRPSRDQVSLRPSLSATSSMFVTNVTSEPTTSITLDQTLFRASTPPLKAISDRNDNDNSNDDDDNDDNDNDDDALLESLSQSINSYENSVSRFSHRVVSTDIPTVFIDEAPGGNDELSSWNKNFFILTSAGKPIYSMHGRDQQVTSLAGIINTIMSYFQLRNSEDIRTISSGNAKFSFLNRSPIMLVAYSRKGETSNELINQLDFLHSYLISSLSQRQLSRFFNKRENFDLRNFLEATDFENLDEICSLICERLYPDVLLGALQCLTLKKTYRTQIHNAMLQCLLKESDLPRGTILYGLIVAPNNKLCSVLRPRGHTLHTTDLHLLFCLIYHQFQNLQNQQEMWVPICFPKFNSNGFLYCYIKFMTNAPQQVSGPKPVLVLISAQKDAFFPLKSLGTNLIRSLQSSELIDKLYRAKTIKITDVPAPLVHHFIYKSRKHVQYVMPELQFATQPDTESTSEQTLGYEKKIMTYYQQIHKSLVRDDGGSFSRSTLSFVQWTATDSLSTVTDQSLFQEENISMMGLAWITPSFELYLICNNGTNDKNVVLKSAKKIVSWCRKHEERLFVNEGAIF